jgi:molybdopterin-guanine dinucleotide biosynthesis protein A
MIKSLSLVIQAGGQSSRMGEDKALKFFLGQPLIQRVVERIGHLAAEVLVTTNHTKAYAFLNLRTVPDLLPGQGTLSGLYTALSCASLPMVAVIACDLPFVSATIFERMVVVLEREGLDVVVPHSGGGLEPMHAVYRRESCLPVVRAALEAGERKAIDWFPRVRVREYTLNEAAASDPSGLAFWNINTPQDFLEAERTAQEMAGGVHEK